jgi:DNA-binding MarR family transcriptional regulator
MDRVECSCSFFKELIDIHFSNSIHTVAAATIAYTIYHMKNKAMPQGCTNLKLRQLGRVVTRHYDSFVSEVGLKNTQYALLSYVVKLGPIRPVDLAKRMQMDASTLTRNLQLLQELGWLTVGAGENARSRLVEATPAGHTKRAEGQRAWKAAQSALNKQLGVERVAALHELLDSCLEYFEGANRHEATS